MIPLYLYLDVLFYLMVLTPRKEDCGLSKSAEALIGLRVAPFCCSNGRCDPELEGTGGQ